MIFRKAKELEALKKKLQEVDPTVDPTEASLKKSLTELEKERMEADKKWEEIQKQEKVLKDFKIYVISIATILLLLFHACFFI